MAAVKVPWMARYRFSRGRYLPPAASAL